MTQLHNTFLTRNNFQQQQSCGDFKELVNNYLNWGENNTEKSFGHVERQMMICSICSNNGRYALP